MTSAVAFLQHEQRIPLPVFFAHAVKMYPTIYRNFFYKLSDGIKGQSNYSSKLTL